MGSLLAFALLLSSVPSARQVIQPRDDDRARPAVQEEPVAALAPDDTSQAIGALPAAIGGVALGGAVCVGVAAGTAVLAPTIGWELQVAGLVGAVFAFVTVPALVVFLFAPELPAFTPFLNLGLVVAGTATGGLLGLAAGIAYVQVTTEPGDDCALCGQDTYFAALIFPLLTAVSGAVVGSVLSTTIGAYAE